MALKDIPSSRRRSRKPFELGFDAALYNPSGLGAKDEHGEYLIPDSALKKEYARLRREATERLRKLGQSEFKTTKTYKENVGKFKPVREVTDRRELERLVQQAARFVTAKGSSASGLRDIRRKQIQTLHEKGYTFVNTRNFQDFTDYMDWLHAQSDKTMFYEILRSDVEDEEDLTPRERKEIADRQEELFEKWRSGNMEGQLKKKKKPGKKKYRSKG